MPTYSLLTATGRVDLDPYRHRGAHLLSVPSSRRGPEEIWNPSGLQDDAIRAAERVALDLLAATGLAQDVSVVKHLATGNRVETSAVATLDSRNPGHAIVSSRRGDRSVAIPAIVERGGTRSYGALVSIAEAVSRRIAEGESSDDAIASVAEGLGYTPHHVRTLAGHGAASARVAADAARAGRSPAVAVLLPTTA